MYLARKQKGELVDHVSIDQQRQRVALELALSPSVRVYS
jgi:hypothetical protein